MPSNNTKKLKNYLQTDREASKFNDVCCIATTITIRIHIHNTNIRNQQ